MKSTQDLCHFLKVLDQHLIQNRTSGINDSVSLEIYSDKSFRIWQTKESETSPITVLLFDSDDVGVDINDIAYGDPVKLAKEIKDNLSVKDIKVEDL